MQVSWAMVRSLKSILGALLWCKEKKERREGKKEGGRERRKKKVF